MGQKMDTFNKLLETGWQSWSTRNKSIIKFPLRDFSPVKDSNLSIPKEIKLKPPISGWCSWYAFFTNITEDIILNQVEWFSENKQIPIEYILIDNKWTEWGDWLYYDRKRFPNGLKYLNKTVKKTGFKPGIWISPFLVSPNSNLIREHPDWIVRIKGKPRDGLKLTPIDSLFPYKKYILDIENEEVIEYLHKCIKKLIEDYGFELLKLDFLYAPYFNPKSRNVDKLLRNFLLKIKSDYPDVYTIGCGCPLIPAIGAVDSMRIGPDIIFPPFEKIPILNRIYHNYTSKMVIENVKKRELTKIFWNLDPDVFLCRKTLGFSENRILYLRNMIKNLNGNIFLGDDMTKLSNERVRKFIIPLFD
ncbi:MAG: hypothetical protein GF368_05665 [Candidatus Aenigmarchaeota archaeon]|nr:hypothetical protein [Candidatus Aenigmarchaeota archaeon]